MVSVTVCPSSTPLVTTVTVPLTSSSTSVRKSPQFAVTEEMVGTVVSGKAVDVVHSVPVILVNAPS